VAAARGLPIPAADEIPPEMARSASNDPRGSNTNINHLTVPITSRSLSNQSDKSSRQETFGSSASQLFRGRAKTLASLATGSKSSSPSGESTAPPEFRLPHDPYVSGLPIEAYLYREPTECPICFLYYPPYLNKTRCCDQPICSECFVQIKRPDPHPPEHEQPGEERPPEEEAETLVSEVASCPFCVTPEFGVTYDPPSFRRGLAYAKSSANSTSMSNNNNPLLQSTSPTASQTSLPTTGRRRTTSLSATASRVITTDRVRPDWAKKLSDARAHALRRGAAATALHNAAYMLGGAQTDSAASRSFGRRRRTLFGESPGESGSGTPTGAEGAVSAARGGRRVQVQDLEDLMMMEAIRLSLAAEEDRARKAHKGARKEGKKLAKEAKKEAKAADKAARKSSGASLGTNASSSSLYPVGSNDSYVSSHTSTAMARSTSNLGQQQASIAEVSEELEGKGKAPAQDFAGYKPLTEPSSTLNTEIRDNAGARHLESSRATLTGQPSPQPMSTSPVTSPLPLAVPTTAAAAGTSTSSGASSLTDRDDSQLPTPRLGDEAELETDTPPPEPNFNFRSLAAMIGEEDRLEGNAKPREEDEHIEHAPALPPAAIVQRRERGDSGESSSSAPPPNYYPSSDSKRNGDDDEIRPMPIESLPSTTPAVEAKGAVDVDVNERRWEATQ
jgi:hypothetical protein